MLRILVAEAPAEARARFVEWLQAGPEVRVVGEAGTGAEAVAQTRRHRPQLVALGPGLPRADGLAAAEQIMTQIPTPVVFLAEAGEDTAGLSAKALQAGALAVVERPEPGGAEATGPFLDTLQALAEVKVVRRRPPRGVRPPARPAAPRPARDRADRPRPSRLVAIAASTGGPPVLEQILTSLPADFPAPILIVQHIAAGFTEGLVSWLAQTVPLPVREAADGEPLEPGTVYVAPDGYHLGVADGCCALSEEPPIGGFRPAATYLFASAARAFGPGLVAVILTGMGRDGVAGLHEVRERGGWTLAQDEATAVVFGMPREAIAAGLADAVLPPDAIAAELRELCADPDA